MQSNFQTVEVDLLKTLEDLHKSGRYEETATYIDQVIKDTLFQQPETQNKLAKELERLSGLYYAGTPEVSDSSFDAAYQLLKTLNPGHPYFQKVNQETKQGKLVKHLVPMLSIQTEVDHSYNGLYRFVQKLKQELQMDKIDLIMEFKYDGLGLSLRYVDGHLVSMTTRGDGDEGEDVIHNLTLFDGDIPRYIPDLPGTFEVRGEALFLTEDFKEINEGLKSENKKLFANARNAVAGTIRTLDTKKIIDRRIKFCPYSLVLENIEEWFQTQEQVLEWFRKHFTFPHHLLVTPKTHTWDLGYLYSVFEAIGKKRSELGFGIDGIVYKVNNLGLQKELGFRSSEPRWAVAQKYPPETSRSELLTIDVQVGRSGKLTPVARIAPVFVDGSTVTNITLHNLFDLRNRGVRIGDEIIVQKAGDVIPEIAYRGKLPPRKPYVRNFRMPHFCPCCDGPVVRNKGDREYYCTNYDCSERVLGRFTHFVSRQCMDIKGLGTETLQQLIKQGKLRYWIDLYGLTEQDLASAMTAPANAPKVLKEIENSKTNEIWRFIHALGIPNVGMGTSKRIAGKTQPANFPTSGNSLMEIDDIGDVIVKSIGEYFSNKTQVSAYYTFVYSVPGVQLQLPLQGGTKLQGQTFSFTGVFKLHKREDYKKMVEMEGGKVSSSVGNKVSYVVVGEHPTKHKVEAANQKSIPVITEEQFLNLYSK